MTLDFGHLPLLLWALLGAIIGGVVALIPALHVYNAAGLVLLWVVANPAALTPEALAFGGLGMVVAYAFLNTLPALYFSAPDESTLFVVLPAQRYLLDGRGPEAAWLSGIGGLGGLAVLLILTPIAPLIFPPLRTLTQPHLHWILGVIVIFMLMSEWPRGVSRGTVWQRFWGTWRSLLIGWLTFALSGALGWVLMYHSPIPVNMAYQNLLPAFVGLFALPAVLLQAFTAGRLPPQHLNDTADVTPDLIGRGVAAGALGGLFAAFFPIVTGGIGGFLAGHATAQRDTRIFIISQGCNKVIYYVGAYWLFFMPNVHLTRGGLAALVSARYTAYTPETYYLAVSAMMFTGILAFFGLHLAARALAQIVPRLPQRWIAAGTLIALVGLVVGFTGAGGLAVAGVGTAIGLLPLLWGSRRMNCLGVLLAPVLGNLLGL